MKTVVATLAQYRALGVPRERLPLFLRDALMTRHNKLVRKNRENIVIVQQVRETGSAACTVEFDIKRSSSVWRLE